jgi:hypothetical protein
VWRSAVGLVFVLMSCGETAAPDASVDATDLCSECDDGLFCNGVESCDAAGCAPGAPPCALSQTCDEAARECRTDCALALDGDGDGHDAIDCGGDDCDDADPARYPGAIETCDAAQRDEDCDPHTFGDTDRDGDAFVDARCCNGDRCGDDCDDERASVHPGEAEECDLADNDCDGAIDEELDAALYYPDCDSDLYGAAGATATLSCGGPPSMPNELCPSNAWSTRAIDCDDTAVAVNPGATERCNGDDDDCDGLVDESAELSCPAIPGTRQVACAAGRCVARECATARGDCDGNSENGCETDLARDERSCGACGVDCAIAHGTAECIASACVAVACEAGYHACGSECVADDSAATCGDRCDPCAVPAGALYATCSSGACGFVCDVGQHACGEACVSSSSVDTCGGRCDPCPLPENAAIARCASESCTFDCAAGYHRCGDTCADSSSAETCGSRCTPCPVPPNAIGAVCGASGCRPTCGAGYHRCGSQCLSDADVASCGARCAACPPGPPGSTAVCTASEACSYQCNAGFIPSWDRCVRGPRPLWPPNTSMLTAARPTFFWELEPSTTGARIEICRDRACSMLVTTRTVAGSSTALTTDLAAGVYFWRLFARTGTTTATEPSATWEFTRTAAMAATSTAQGTVLDLNGDGYADVAIGAPGASGGRGRVHVYYGGATLPTAPSVSIDAPELGQRFGTSVASAGDFDGDGFGDLVVGAPMALPFDPSFPVSPALYVYRGGASGVAATPFATLIGPPDPSHPFMAPDRTLQLGAAVSAAGDVDGDGYADIIAATHGPVGQQPRAAYLFRGRPNGVSIAEPMVIGRTVAGAGDFDGDRFSDFVVADDLTDRVTVYFGAGVGAFASTSLPEFFANEAFGASIAAVGDTNGDGRGDLVIGAPGPTPRVIVYGFVARSPTSILRINGTGGFGRLVASAGDINGGGSIDTLVGAPTSNRVDVYYGGTTTSAGFVTGAGSFGASAWGADLRRRGVSDFVVCGPNASSDTGSCTVYSDTGAVLRTWNGPDGSSSLFGAVSR